MSTRQKLSKLSIINDNKTLKKLIRKQIDNNKLNNALELIKTASSIAYHLNFTFFDDEMEQMCFEIGKRILHKLDYSSLIKKKEEIFFYDCFGFDSRGLTQQYIRALFANNIPFTYILNSDVKKFKESAIYNELIQNNLTTILILDNDLKSTDKVVTLYKILSKCNNSKIFMHMSPNDSVGVSVFSQLKNSVKFQINLTDHAFWLGVSIVDYNIEFREYGRSLSTKYRGISKEKELYLPYYPLINTNASFKGFPFEKNEDKVLILTGGSLYKFYGDNDTFFKLAYEILMENPEASLLVAGDGDREPFQKFIGKFKLEDRLFLLGNRSDLSALMNEVDIYIGSYPVCGGLMSQYAVNSQKPIVQYTRKDLPTNIIDTLFPCRKKNVTATYFSKKSFISEVSILIKSVDARVLKGKDLCDSLMTNIEFNKRFIDIFNMNNNCLFSEKAEDYNIDTELIFEMYLEQENNYLRKYPSILIRKILIILMRYLPFFTVKIIMKNIGLLFKELSTLFLYKLKKLFSL